MRYTVWCPKRCCSPFSSPQHQSTCGRHAMCIGDHDVYHRSDRSVFKWDAIESAPTSKCLRVTQETFKQNSRGHSLHPGKIDAQVQCIRLGFPSPSREVGLADLRTRSATQLPTPRSSILRRRYTVYSRLHRVLRQHILSLKACAITNFFGIWASCRVAVQVLRSRAKTVGRCRVRRRRARRMLTVDIRVCRSRHSQATHAIMMA